MKKPPLERKWFGIWHRHSWGQWEVVPYTYREGERRERKCLTCQLKQWEWLYE